MKRTQRAVWLLPAAVADGEAVAGIEEARAVLRADPDNWVAHMLIAAAGKYEGPSVDASRHLAAVEAELQRTASAESWTIDWRSHEDAYTQAKNAYAARDFPLSFRHYALAIDILMAGLHECRKQLHREAKWGKSAANA